MEHPVILEFQVTIFNINTSCVSMFLKNQLNQEDVSLLSLSYPLK